MLPIPFDLEFAQVMFFLSDFSRLHRRARIPILAFLSITGFLTEPSSGLALEAKDHEIVYLPENSPPEVRWAVSELKHQLGLDPTTAKWVKGQIVVKLSETGDEPQSSREHKILLAESFDLESTNEGRILINSHGSVGAMYGLLELQEQIAFWSGSKTKPGIFRVEPVRARPAVNVRADNMFVHVDENGHLMDWFFEDPFWSRYLALLARSRFNMLDLHGAYCPSTSRFSNLWILFSGSGETQVKNRKQLARIVRQARERGLQVGLMNYGGALPGKDRNDRMKATAKAVEEILKTVPGLALFGTKLKRTGDQAVTWFSNVYVQPWRRSGSPGTLYTRTWGTDLDAVKAFADLTESRLRVEVKYNGEHLGLPYQAVQGWGEDYSFQNFLLPQKKFKVIWQVRASGTHRVFPWGASDYIRTAVKSFSLGHAVGFSLEPPWAYSTVKLENRYRRPKLKATPDAKKETQPTDDEKRYLFERHWAWYHLWGRIGFDPECSTAALSRRFIIAMGRKRGLLYMETLHRMSKIVPLVYASCCPGLDHRDAAPEFEFGFLHRDRQQAPRSLDEMAKVGPLDRSRGCSPHVFAAGLAGERINFREGPLDFAGQLDAAALGAEQAAQELAQDLTERTEHIEAASLVLEANCVAALGRSTASRLRALTYYELFKIRGGRENWLRLAKSEMRKAQQHWQQLATWADQLYRPVDDPLRAGKSFRWRSGVRQYEALRKELDVHSETSFRSSKEIDIPDASTKDSVDFRKRVFRQKIIFDYPEIKFSREGKKQLLGVELRFDSAGLIPEELQVLYKALQSESTWKVKAMKKLTAGHFSVRLGEPRGGLLLQFRGVRENQGSLLWPKRSSRIPFVWTQATLNR